MPPNRNNLAYVIGLALGDGNLSNPNGRAVRLRITCDTKYQNLIKRAFLAIKKLLPNNKVAIVNRAQTFCDISCYSNRWEELLGWKAKGGSKYKQNVSIPNWIKTNKNYAINCLRGLLETDGSIYFDRGYKMVNFVTVIPTLAEGVMEIINKIDFEAKIYKIKSPHKDRYNIRITKNVECFLKTIKLAKD
jgi:DNA-binding transcriptional regulator WhiA